MHASAGRPSQTATTHGWLTGAPTTTAFPPLAVSARRRGPGAEPREQRRWLRPLVVPFVIGFTFFATTIATGHTWLLGPAIVLGPILMLGTFVYLMLSSEANTEATRPATVNVVARQRRERGRRRQIRARRPRAPRARRGR